MSIWNFGNSPLLSARALFLSEALLSGRDDWDPAESEPIASQFGVFGVGLASLPEGQPNFVVCMLMDEARVNVPATPSGIVLLPDVPDAVKMVQVLFGNVSSSTDLQWINSVAILPVPPPTPNTGPGNTIHAAQRGLAGIPVTWNYGKSSGILTAGHLGPVGTVVTDGTSTIGMIVFSSDPALCGGKISADVALVELTGGITLSGGHAVSGRTHPAPAANVDVSTQTGIQTVALMGEAVYINMLANGMYGSMYFSVSGVTEGGDSGGPVFISGGTDVIGHVVGSSGAATSYFQDVKYQMDEIRSDPSFATLKM